MEKKGWKVTAIIFIIIFLINCGFYYIGYKDMERENECAYNVCEVYPSYTFDSYSGLCSCYENHEIKLTKYVR